MTDVMDDARRIKRGILDFIHTYGCEQAPEEAFGALARDVFIYQYTYDLPYRRYCAAKRVTPATLKDWREIPPMPVDGFKHLDHTDRAVRSRIHDERNHAWRQDAWAQLPSRS